MYDPIDYHEEWLLSRERQRREAEQDEAVSDWGSGYEWTETLARRLDGYEIIETPRPEPGDDVPF